MNINGMVDTISTLLRSAQTIVDNMVPQERKKLTDLAAEAGATVGMDADDALPHITWFAHNCDGIELSKGRTGGLYKGSKPAPIRKSRKKI
jgi:hypothetical protein